MSSYSKESFIGTRRKDGHCLVHGVLFHIGTKGEICQRLVEKNYIDTVISLSASLFTNTGIPVMVIF
ncbi:N-6 DNA methylase [Facklamia sp. P12945]|uniref:N-6 DNA methylase n=1 Tax=unclassified Facklamia TaxID=2622293 RepID=UPI003D1639C6